MRSLARFGLPVRPGASIAVVALLASIGGIVSGCGGPGRRETDSAIERTEDRPYGPVTVRSALAPKRVTLGDSVEWRLLAILPGATRVTEFHLEEPPEALELDPRPPAGSRRGAIPVSYERRYVVRAFDLGVIELPGAALTVVYGTGPSVRTDTLYFPPDSIAVDSLTPAPTGSIERDRGPIDPGLRPVDVIVAATLAALVVAALVALLLLWRRRRRAASAASAAAPPEPPEAPYGRALAALRSEGAGLPRDLFHERLSDAIRRYVADVAGVDAIDRTTRELERELRASGRAMEGAPAEIARILRRSDLVKFARREDDWADALALLDDAERLKGRVAVAPGEGAS
jgi:hypothetical protein